jgi:hypothetical protein
MATVVALVRYLDDPGHEHIQRFEAAGVLNFEESLAVYPADYAIRKQLAVVSDLIHQSRARNFILVRKRRATVTSRPGPRAA